MKKILLPIALLALLFSANSCQKCFTCTNPNVVNDEFQVCKKDAASFDADRTRYEAAGYECKDKLRSN